MLLVITITLISVYLSLVVGTIKKFKINGINLSFTSKVMTVFLPLVIFAIHLKMAIENVKENRHMSLEILKMGTIYYPAAVGILIEISLEKFAQRAVYGQSLTRVNKEPININAGTLNRQRSSLFNVYEKATADIAAC